MEDFEYPGIRMVLEATLERMRQKIKLDISTDDVITPSAVEYEYKLMFENRTISLLTYNIETLLAEKVQTIFARGISNTRFRDFYDVYRIVKMNTEKIDKDTLMEAFCATCEKRETIFSNEEMTNIFSKIKSNETMAQMWEKFREKNFFVGELQWDEVLNSVLLTMDTYIL